MKKFYEMTQAEFLSILPNGDYEPYAAIWSSIIGSVNIIKAAQSLRNHEYNRPAVYGGKPYHSWINERDALTEELYSVIASEGLVGEAYYMALVVADRIVKHRKSIIEAIAKGYAVPANVIAEQPGIAEILSAVA